MGVGGGAGNAISFSELQTFYGGSNPISLSEYYRNGSLVPGDQVAAQSNTPGSSSQTIGEFTATVSGVLGSPSSASISGGSSVTFTITSTTSRVVLTCNGSGTAFFYYRNTPSGSLVSIGSFNIGGDSDPDGPISAAVRGPNYDSADGSATISVPAGGQFIASGSGGVNVTGGTHTTRPGLFDVSFRNNNAITITTTSGSTGGAQTYTQNQTRQVKNDSTSASYTLGYDAILGNTNVPASGTINMNVFNAPGNATP
tara:strand:+ start:2814 stop:3581 length:768 start_codon:yes stop_codon:yes gene_type:complete